MDFLSLCQRQKVKTSKKGFYLSRHTETWLARSLLWVRSSWWIRQLNWPRSYKKWKLLAIIVLKAPSVPKVKSSTWDESSLWLWQMRHHGENTLCRTASPSHAHAHAPYPGELLCLLLKRLLFELMDEIHLLVQPHLAAAQALQVAADAAVNLRFHLRTRQTQYGEALKVCGCKSFWWRNIYGVSQHENVYALHFACNFRVSVQKPTCGPEEPCLRISASKIHSISEVLLPHSSS